jgi:hypothetical protein
VEREQDKELVPTHRFCPRCHQPWRYWDGEGYSCWRCGCIGSARTGTLPSRE